MAIGKVIGMSTSSSRFIGISDPVQTGTLEWTGNVRTPSWNIDAGNGTQYDVTYSTTSAINAGTYSAYFTPKGLYVWAIDNTATTKTVPWTIARAAISAVPVPATTMKYTGSAQNITWSSAPASGLTTSGVSGTTVGTYTAVVTPDSNHRWSDALVNGGTVASSIAAKSISWSIGRMTLAKPTLSAANSVFTYNGSAKTVATSSFSSFNTTYEQITGGNTGTNASTTYKAIVALKDKNNTCWSDGSTTDQTYPWTINKANQTVSVVNSSNSAITTVNFSTGTTRALVTVNRSGTGAITATVTDSSIVTCTTVDGTTNQFAIVVQKNGSTTITFNVATDTNWNAASTTITASVALFFTALNQHSPAEIKTALQYASIYNTLIDTASPVWSVGDDTQEITLAPNGPITVGCRTFNKDAGYHAYVLSFNHKVNNVDHAETSGSSTLPAIHFCLGRRDIIVSGATVRRQIAFVDNQLLKRK